MKVIVAIDSFKGSLTSMEAGKAAKNGILKAGKFDVIVKPLADGGEGTTEALISGLGGEFIDISVTGPLNSKVNARYGILADKRTAIIEMAEAAGITLVKREELDPWHATTYGLGEMILDAVERGCRKFIIGIGGSATTEVGFGMLQALGVKFFDERGNLLSHDFEELEKVETIDASGMDARLSECSFQIACDVKNPLYGSNGAVWIFGPQKGVKPEEKAKMDNMVCHFAHIVDKELGVNYDDVEGTGAAGGLGFAFKSFFKNIELKPGIDIVIEAIGLEKLLDEADIVVTGEGRLDGQTAMGKVPVGVAKLAKKYGCKVIAVAGAVTEDSSACNNEGIDAFFPILRSVCTLDEAMLKRNAKYNMESTVEQIFRLISVI